LSGPTYDKKLNATIWKTETQVVKENPTPGQPLGGIDTDNVAQLVAMLHQFKIVPSSVTDAKAEAWFDTSFVKDIYNGDKLVWPAP
jgi:putative hydroxymethylpyrimidine transport system substrate-binding protein